MNNKTTSIYNLSKTEREIVAAKLQDLLNTCRIYQLPMFASVAVSNSKEKTEYMNTIYGSNSHDVILANDHIKKHSLIANNFEAVPKRDVITTNVAEIFNIE